ncbi:hypothetical protein CG723_04840 [Streptomyces sp. CB01635]|uniref:hypothetical protein n=1 Tax=unclassified Streptomyces TaxID=2593676 RepID=UPI000C27328E|nr:hypothetical protein [Streptomyces sp. CB01635]PJN12381.1 hypothetical protein CG723_04840 [Streptomyces sp. CB01635]
MKSPLKKTALVVAAAGAALGLAAAPSSAASTNWAVGPNSPETVTATSSNVLLGVNGIDMTCTYADATAALQSATGNPAQVGTIAPANFGRSGEPCTSILGNVTTTTTTPWRLWVEGDYDAATGTSPGFIDNIKATVTVATCSFDVTGTAHGSYKNGGTGTAGKLTVATNATELTTSNVSAGCAGIISNGDHPSFNGVYDVVVSGTSNGATIVGS